MTDHADNPANEAAATATESRTEPAANVNLAALMTEVVKYLVDSPDEVHVTEVEGEQTTVIELKVAKSDLGKIIGKQGNNARSLRTILAAVSTKLRKRSVLEILRRMRLVELPVDREIIVVDDGSTDGTDKVLGAVEDSTVRMLRHPSNQGKGAAIRTGLAR